MPNLAETVQRRRAQWLQLEQLLAQLNSRKLKKMPGKNLTELSDLYRSACADLAMADQYRLSPATVDYLHSLVGRAHNTIYRSRHFQVQQWWDVAFRQAPQQIFRDRCVHLCGIVFFGLFGLSCFLALNEQSFPGFAERMLGKEQMEAMQDSFTEADFHSDSYARSLDQNMTMVAFYIQHNTGIGLQCFSMGPLIIPGLYMTAFNGSVLGASFGYMARGDTPGGNNFLEFVTAHGAFELTAIALAAAAGLRIGMGWLVTGGLTRLASLQRRAVEAVPVMAVSGVLFFLAALTEGLLSPTTVPYLFKAMWGVFASTLLVYYFVVLGYPTEPSRAT
ncbi:MAG: stage II sporulation protein M [Planctomycetales bacterium]|nr:stage II sporulation protein M [Planctomycetales bacterium]MCA9181765.1 stage II sporulation protein M [Planctomycetales bacterium]